LMQTVCDAFSLARARAGRSKLARMAIMAMTTRSSMRVNARSAAEDGVRAAERFIGTVRWYVRAREFTRGIDPNLLTARWARRPAGPARRPSYPVQTDDSSTGGLLKGGGGEGLLSSGFFM